MVDNALRDTILKYSALEFIITTTTSSKTAPTLIHRLATPLRGLSGQFASLVVSKKVLRFAASRIIGALRFARGFKKVPPTYGDFDFFFPKYRRFWNLKLDFFPTEKFLKFFLEIQWITSLSTNSVRSFKKFAEYFFCQNTPDFKSWSWNIFRSKKFFAKRLNMPNYLFSN